MKTLDAPLNNLTQPSATQKQTQEEPTTQGWAWAELQGANLPDKRFKNSMAAICQDLYRQPEISFSRACGNKRKAMHRLINNTQVTAQDLLIGHAQQSQQRAKAYPFFLAASDTTCFEFTSHPQTRGLGPIGSTPKSQGFLTHSVLALSPGGTPLGVIYQQSWVRDPEDFGKSHQRDKRELSDKESKKWAEALHGVESILEDDDQILLIQDREADIFSFLQEPRREKTHLLVRSSHPRRVLVQGEQTTLFNAARAAPVVAQKTLMLKVKKGKEFYDRDVFLTLRCTQVEILAPHRSKSDKPHPVVWVICATEENPPEGFDAIEWILLSTFAVPDGQTALDMVEFYSKRWLIERFHFVLKSGLGVERLQFDAADSLMSTLSLYSIVAWRLLCLTYLAREDPDAPASCLFDALSLEVLSAHSGKSICRLVDAVSAVARVGGFRACPSAPRAGVKSLWLGLRRLDAMEEGWQMAKMGLPPPKDTGQD